MQKEIFWKVRLQIIWHLSNFKLSNSGKHEFCCSIWTQRANYSLSSQTSLQTVQIASDVWAKDFLFNEQKFPINECKMFTMIVWREPCEATFSYFISYLNANISINMMFSWWPTQSCIPSLPSVISKSRTNDVSGLKHEYTSIMYVYIWIITITKMSSDGERNILKAKQFSS